MSSHTVSLKMTVTSARPKGEIRTLWKGILDLFIHKRLNSGLLNKFVKNNIYINPKTFSGTYLSEIVIILRATDEHIASTYLLKLTEEILR